MKAHCLKDKKGEKFPFDAKKGYVDGLVILANSVYSQRGKSTKEKIHNITEFIYHPKYASEKLCNKWLIETNTLVNITLS
jgi:hypothetical protein